MAFVDCCNDQHHQESDAYDNDEKAVFREVRKATPTSRPEDPLEADHDFVAGDDVRIRTTQGTVFARLTRIIAQHFSKSSYTLFFFGKEFTPSPTVRTGLVRLLELSS